MLKHVMEAKTSSFKRKNQWVNVSEDGDDSEEQVDFKGKGIMNLLRNSTTSSDTSIGQQSTINQMFKKDLREEACQQVVRFFYTSSIPFNCVKNPEFTKMCEIIGKYGLGFKPPSYHEIREKYLNLEVKNAQTMIEEFKSEWKRTGCSIMSDGWTNKKRHSICNFLVNSPKGTVFLYSLDTSDISKTADKVAHMLDEVVEKVGEENVVQIITDNAANYKAAG